MFDLFVFAGEMSGDLHGEQVVKALLSKRPTLKITGVAGPKMRSCQMHPFMQMEAFQVMGYVDVLFAIPKLFRQFKAVKQAILNDKPKAVLLIDYPGFNLRLAKSLRKSGYLGKIIHYICPSVWAHGKGRIKHMAKTLDLLLTIFPFEKECFSKTSLQVDYVGHPLVKRIASYKHEDIQVPSNKTVIGIFPGSRKKELDRNFAMQLGVAKRLLSEHPDLFFLISCSEKRFLAFIQDTLEKFGLKEHSLIVSNDKSYDLMKKCTLAIAKSGTVTLELGLHKIPTVVTYAISPLDLFITRDLLRIRLPHYCIVNIALNERVFPELFGPEFTEEKLYGIVKDWLTNPVSFEACRKKCDELHKTLQEKDSGEEASRLILARL